jgi:hypothetical protein
MNNYEDIIKKVDHVIDRKAATEIGQSLIDGFKGYMLSDNVPDEINTGAASKGIASAAAYTLAICASQHSPHTSNDMKVTFLAYFDRMYEQNLKRLIQKEGLK